MPLKLLLRGGANLSLHPPFWKKGAPVPCNPSYLRACGTGDRTLEDSWLELCLNKST